jgi:hypothetical protein
MSSTLDDEKTETVPMFTNTNNTNNTNDANNTNNTNINESRSCRNEKHCERIYENLVKNVSVPFFKDPVNKEQLMSQLKQQMDYVYARRYGKKRIG